MGYAAALLGRKRIPRPPKPHDAWTKAQLWARIVKHEKALAHVMAVSAYAARDAHHAGHSTERDKFHEINRLAEFTPAEQRGPR